MMSRRPSVSDSFYEYDAASYFAPKRSQHKNEKHIKNTFSFDMPRLRDVRELLLYANYDGLIDDEEFLLLYDLNTAKSPDFPYWNYEQFDLDKFYDDECLAEFRFLKNDIYNLVDIMRLPDILTCYNGVKVEGIEGMCIFLKRFAYPCR